MSNDNGKTPPSIRYVVDDDTQELLEIMLNHAMQLADLQIDNESREALLDEIEDLAERFSISRNRVEIETVKNEDGSTTLTVHSQPLEIDPTKKVVKLETPNNKRPHLSVVKAEDPPTTDDEPTTL